MTLHHEVLKHQQLKLLQISSLVYMRDQHLNGSVTISGCLVMTASTPAWRGSLMLSSECVITRALRSNKRQQSGSESGSRCDLGKIKTPVWWSLISIWWGGGSNVFQHSLLWCDLLVMRDNFVPTWFPIITTGPKYQHKISFMSKILFESHHLNPWENMEWRL